MPPKLLVVGERKPTDKHYETKEVVLAAPGTVVAPVPKGMDVNPKTATALIISQLMDHLGMLSGKPKKAGPKGVQGAQAGTITSPNDPYKTTDLLSAFANLLANYNLGQGRLSLDTLLGKGNLALGKGNLALGQSSLAANTRAQDLDRAMQELLTKGGWQNQLQLAGLSNASAEKIAGQRTAADIRGQDINAQLGNRQLDLTAAQNAFDRIMRGVSEASVPGVRAGRVPTGGVI